MDCHHYLGINQGVYADVYMGSSGRDLFSQIYRQLAGDRQANLMFDMHMRTSLVILQRFWDHNKLGKVITRAEKVSVPQEIRAVFLALFSFQDSLMGQSFMSMSHNSTTVAF